MMFCPECGCELEKDALFCPECGTKVEQEEAESQVAEKTEPIKAVSKKSLEEKPANKNVVAIDKDKTQAGISSKQKITIGIVIAVAVIVIAVVAVVLTSQPAEDTTQQDEATTQEVQPEESANTQPDEQKTQSKYILENSATKELTEADIAGLSDDEICKAQNEIWARHGRKFKNNWLQDYFNNQSWYSGTIEADEFLSKYSPTDVENKNAQFLNSALSSRGYDLNKAHPNGMQTTSATGDVATLTQQIKDDGYNMVVQGEVRLHGDSAAGSTYITPYIRLNEYAEMKGYQVQEYKVRETMTIGPTSSYNGEFRNHDQVLAYFQKLSGHQVLIGIHNDSQDVQFASGTPCSFYVHTQQECDLMNSGWPTFVTNFEVKDLG